MARFTIHQKDKNHKEIVDALRALGFHVEELGDPWDLAVTKPGSMDMRFADIKDPKKRGWKDEFTEKQKKFLERWPGPPIIIFRTVEDVLNFRL